MSSAQALLEKAIAIDPNYGQALGVLATSYIFCAHMGWDGHGGAVPIAEPPRCAAIRADSEDPWAHNALGHVYLFARRFDDSLAEFETGAAAQSELRAGAGLLRPVALLLRPLAGCRRGRPSRDPAEPARSHSPRSITVLPPMPSSSAATMRKRCGSRGRPPPTRDFVGAHRVLMAAAGMAGTNDIATGGVEGARRAQPNISLAWIADTCRSSSTPTASTISKAFAAPA